MGKAKKAPTKTEILNNVAESTSLSKKQVSAVLDALTDQIKKALSSRGPGMFTIPGLIKIDKKKVPAKPEREGINPFTKEPTIFKAKPASTKVRVRPLKNLKDMV